MSRTVEATGKSVAAATAKALKQMGVPSDQAEIAVIGRGRRGLFGLFGGTPARVRVTHRLSTRDRAEGILQDLLKRMHISCQLDVVERRNDLHITIETAGTDSLLTGQGGLTVISLEYLVNRMLQNENRKGQRVLLDVAGHKRSRDAEAADEGADDGRSRRGGRRGERRPARERQPVAAGAAGAAGGGTGRSSSSSGGRRRSGRGRRRRGPGGPPKAQPQGGEQA